MFARISVNISAISGLYDYTVPAEIAPHIQAGCLVVAPFGNQTVQGIVLELTDSSSIQNPKPIIDLLDPAPVLTPPQIALAIRLADTTLNPLASIVNLMIPTGLSQQADVLYQIIDRGPQTTDHGPSSTVSGRLAEAPHRTRPPPWTPDRLPLRQSGLAQDGEHARQKRRAFCKERVTRSQSKTKVHSRCSTVG